MSPSNPGVAGALATTMSGGAVARGPARSWGVRGCLIALGLLVLLAVGARVIALVQLGVAEGDDFTAYWDGARAVAAGHSPYEWLRENRPLEISDYHYAPLLAVLLAPLTPLLTYEAARWLWLLFSVGCLAAALVVIWRTSGLRLDRARPAAALPFVILLPAMVSALGTGKVSPQLLLLIAAAYALLADERAVAAGGAFALVAYLKSFPGLLVGYLLLRRRWRALAATVVSGLVLLGLTLLVLGWEPHWAYLTGVVPAQRRWFGMPLDISLNGFWTRLLIPNLFTTPLLNADLLGLALIALTSAAVLAATAWAIWRAPADARSQGLCFALAVAAMLLVTPINGHYNLIIAALPLAVLAADVQRTWPRGLRGLLVVLLFLSLPVEPCDLAPLRDWCLAAPSGALADDLVWRQGWGTLLISGPLFGLVLLWALLFLRCRALGSEGSPARADS
ncbi:MAG TPA: glycosyltransferase family 87 protein [Chloroflexota bacterium]|nr:glycosyltransferase family 87 protein [Chloroflexota bacterium]